MTAVQKHGGSIALNWFEAVKDRRERNSQQDSLLDRQEIVANNLDATTRADALIIEGSRFNYSQGYQTALAIEHGRPVLNLYRKGLPDYIEKPDKLFVSGITSPLFQSKSYENEGDIHKIISKFFNDITPKTVELDIKLALDRSTNTYLEHLHGYQRRWPSYGMRRDTL